MALSTRNTGPAAEPVAAANRAEADQLEADERAQVRPAAPVEQPRTSPGYVRATNPDGEPVVFVPGEQLPVWVADKLDAGTAKQDPETGAWVLP